MTTTNPTPRFTWPIPAAVPHGGTRTAVLRPLRESDASDVTLAACDPMTVAFTQMPQPYSEKDAQEFLGKILSADDQKQEKGSMFWAIEDPDEPGRWAGTMELRLQSLQHKTVSVGYNVGPWARGKGLATSALNQIVAHSFAHGVHRFELSAIADNVASRRVAANCGFVFEGIARSSHFLRGVFLDLAQYSLVVGDDPVTHLLASYAEKEQQS